MLQTVIYYVVFVTVILTKELVIATDNCTEYQFKTPFSYVGESCEDIYNKNAKATSDQNITPLHTRFIVERAAILDHLVRTSSRSIQKFTELIQKRSQDTIA